jgi:hypothetical protein
MANIRFTHPSIVNGTIKLVDGTSLTFTAGVAGATPAQEMAAINSGCTRDDPGTPFAPIRAMKVPTGGGWPTSGSVTSPDGQTITITAGVAPVPQAWCNTYLALGWQFMPGHDRTAA